MKSRDASPRHLPSWCEADIPYKSLDSASVDKPAPQEVAEILVSECRQVDLPRGELTVLGAWEGEATAALAMLFPNRTVHAFENYYEDRASSWARDRFKASTSSLNNVYSHRNSFSTRRDLYRQTQIALILVNMPGGRIRFGSSTWPIFPTSRPGALTIIQAIDHIASSEARRQAEKMYNRGELAFRHENLAGFMKPR